MTEMPRCSICDQPLKPGEHVRLTCTGFTDDGESILNPVHITCLDSEAAAFRDHLDTN